MSLRQEFVSLAAERTLPFSELCRRFNISRQTGYKWLGRHAAHGPEGLVECSRRPHESPTRSPDAVVGSVPELRRQHEYPNSLWQMDFKGDFPTLEAGRCSALTVLDDHSAL